MDLFTHDWEGDSSVLESIVEAIESVRDPGPNDGEVLYAVVDPDALVRVLESLRRSGDPDSYVEFAYDRYRVTVTARGTIAVRSGWAGPPARIASESDFQAALDALLRKAVANGLAVEGGWTVTAEGGYPAWIVEIFEVEDRDGGRRSLVDGR